MSELITPTDEQLKTYLLTYCDAVEGMASVYGDMARLTGVTAILHAFQGDYPGSVGPAPAAVEWRPIGELENNRRMGSCVYYNAGTITQSPVNCTHYLTPGDLRQLPVRQPKTPRQIAEEEFEAWWSTQQRAGMHRGESLKAWLAAKGIND